MKKIILIISLFLIICSLSKGTCLGTIYYIDYKNGSDSNSGTSSDLPWKRCPGMPGFVGSPSSLSPGDLVYFKKGVTWPAIALPLYINFEGTVTDPITFTSTDSFGSGDKPIFDAGSTEDYCIDINDEYTKNKGRYIVVDGLDLRNPDSSQTYVSAISIKGSHNIVRNCKIYTGGIYVNSNNSTIENNEINSNDEVFGVRVYYSSNVTVKENNIFGFTQEGIRTAGGSQSITIEKNYIHSPGTPGVLQMGICYRSTNNSIYRYNIIDLHGSSSDYGMHSWTEGPYYGNNKIYNNVVIMNGTDVGISSGTDDNVFTNNIIYNAGIGCRMQGDNNSIDYTCVYSSSTLYDFRGSGNVWSSNNYTFDPKFADTSFDDVDDFKMRSDSPCRDKGIDFDGYYGTDYWGTVVPQPEGSNLDIGAFEYVEGGNQPPNASFNANPNSGDTPLTVQFTDTSSDTDGTIASWNWNFGDGGTSAAQNPSHTYNSAGTYTVTLTVTDDDDATDSASTTISVSSPGNQLPNASFNANPSSGEPPLSVQFTDTSADPDGEIVSWNWNFGDGGRSTEQNPGHTYNSAGTYTATLMVTDDDDATNSASTTISVSSGEKVSIYIEAESGTLESRSPIMIGNDPNLTASGGKYVYAPSGSGDTTNPTPEAVYNIDIPYAGDYYIWLRMYGPASDNDAMYIGFNGSFDRVYTTQWEMYEWVRVETTDGSENFVHLLSAGTNQINISHGEELAGVDIILVTDDPDFVPSGTPADITPEVPSAPSGLGVSVISE